MMSIILCWCMNIIGTYQWRSSNVQLVAELQNLTSLSHYMSDAKFYLSLWKAM